MDEFSDNIRRGIGSRSGTFEAFMLVLFTNNCVLLPNHVGEVISYLKFHICGQKLNNDISITVCLQFTYCFTLHLDNLAILFAVQLKPGAGIFLQGRHTGVNQFKMAAGRYNTPNKVSCPVTSYMKKKSQFIIEDWKTI